MKRTRTTLAVAAISGLSLLLGACAQGSASQSGTSSQSSPTGDTSSSSSQSSSESSGSSSESSPAASGSDAPADAVTGDVTYMEFSSNGGHEADLKKIVDAFESANPGIKVTVQTLPYADYFTKLQTAIAGGTAADAFELDYQHFVSYSASGALAPLSDVDPAPYKKSLIDAFNVGGKQFALPESFSDVVLFYNKDLFDKAGVAPPNADWTWADENAAAKKLTDKAKGVWGDYQPISYNEFYKVLAQNGGQFFNADKTAATFASPQGIAAAHQLIDRSGTVMPTAADGAGTPDFDTNLFKSGKLAMWHTGIWMFGALKDVPFNWDIAVEPGNTNKASAMFANSVAVSATSKNAAAAQKWLEFLTSSDAMVTARLASGWELPPISDATKLGAYLDQPKPANRKAVFDALDNAVLPPTIERQQEMQDAIDNALTGAAAGHTKIEDSLPAAEKTVTSLLGG
ncbi:MAG: ABC transporter [Actinobacteria bacterium 69-20]|nr:MAG: ABC transporter [Actinobacteria bacterium 69-20]